MKSRRITGGLKEFVDTNEEYKPDTAPTKAFVKALREHRFIKTKILMIYPKTDLDKKDKSIGLPLSILHTISSFDKNKFEFFIIDQRLDKDWEDTLIILLKNHSFLCVGISTMTGSQIGWGLEVAKIIRESSPNTKIIFGGIHPTIYPEQTIKHPLVDIIVIGDGESTFPQLVNALKDKTQLNEINGLCYLENEKIIKTGPTEMLNLNDFPEPDYSLIDVNNYFFNLYHTVNALSLVTGRGCPHRCLSGDTKINTIYGDITIKELAKKYKKIGVYTYDKEKDKVIIAEATNILKIGKNEELVRVYFDDGTHIDCTPDHKFLTFKSGNQFGPTKHKIKEAKDLKPKESVKAMKFYKSSDSRYTVSWGRKDQRRHILVMEYILGRELKGTEQVHHKDKNKSNDLPENLLLCNSMKEHFQYHPEVAKRMREDNPQKYCTKESYEKMRKKITGLKRSLQSRINIRNSKLGEKNPNWKGGYARDKQKKPSSIKEINHKVIKVEILKEKQDVYCMEVPKHHWFFANNVLVHNCSFCYNQTFNKGKWRALSVEKIIKRIKTLVGLGAESIHIIDDNFFTDVNRVKEICKIIKEEKINIKFVVNCRVDYIVRFDNEFLKLLYDTGFNEFYIGVESGSQKILDYIKKDTNVKQVYLCNEKLKKCGIIPIYSFMAGFPNETFEDIQKTINMMMKLLKDNPSISLTSLKVYTPFPGSELFDECVKYGLKVPKSFDEWSEFSYNSSSYNWRPKKMNKLLKKLSYITYFLDQKTMSNHFDTNFILKTLIKIYSKYIWYRCKIGFYHFMPEVYIMEKLRRMIS